MNERSMSGRDILLSSASVAEKPVLCRNCDNCNIFLVINIAYIPENVNGIATFSVNNNKLTVSFRVDGTVGTAVGGALIRHVPRRAGSGRKRGYRREGGQAKPHGRVI